VDLNRLTVQVSWGSGLLADKLQLTRFVPAP
jgi:hypothetical protein